MFHVKKFLSCKSLVEWPICTTPDISFSVFVLVKLLWYFLCTTFTLKNVVSYSDPFWKLISRFFITKSFQFFNVFIGIINDKKKFLLYLIPFYTGFLRQSRHLQNEEDGWCGWFRHLESSETKKQKRLLCSILVAPSRTRINHFY